MTHCHDEDDNMERNIIYVFSGTGNSLKVARDISVALGNCRLASMGTSSKAEEAPGLDTIGFVFPTYYRGEPRRVGEFIQQLDLRAHKNAYVYAVTTMGRYDGNSLCHVMRLLRSKGITLGYARALDMYSNYVISYDMADTVAEETRQSDLALGPIIQDIKNRATNKVARWEPLQEVAYRSLIAFVHDMDRHYTVSDACTGCGICEKVCPVDNISPDGAGRPLFHHRCEQCVACIQFCPTRAINYKDRTQGRRRYTHPAIKFTDLAALNGKTDSTRTVPRAAGSSSPGDRPRRSVMSALVARALWRIYGM
jgi:ferredoxin/flavodoxin